MSAEHTDTNGDQFTDAQRVGVPALYEAGVYVKDICSIMGVSRTQFATLITRVGANRDDPITDPDSPWWRVGVRIAYLQNDAMNLARRVHGLEASVRELTAAR